MGRDLSVYGEYFYGNKISDYGLEHNRVDYRTLAKAFDAVLNNDIMSRTAEIGYWEQESGFVDNSEEIEEKRNEIEEIESAIDNYLSDDEIEKAREQIEEIESEIEELENEQDEMPEVFQWYIVSDNGAEILREAGEILFYNETLDMYLWGVTHYGTSWDYVLTDIPCNTGKM